MRACFVVSVKAFGDFVIAANCLRRVETAPPGQLAPQLLAGDHLADLARDMGLEQAVRFISTGGQYPAAYDVHGRGIWRALGSVLMLRKQFRMLPSECDLLLENIRWREKIIGAGFAKVDFSLGENIYISLAEALRSVGYALAPPTSVGRGQGLPRPGRVVIFPSSRVAKKIIPAPAVGRIMDQLHDCGLEGEVVRLGDEPLELPTHLSAHTVERSFRSLIKIIRGSDLVVSADSLPAHLAEYLGVPTYVFSPAPNRYWLPLSAFQENSWCLFDDQHAMAAWLAERVAVPQTRAISGD